MKPYYQDDYVTIYHGDCLEIVPQMGRFDLLLTDPPYGMQYVSGRRAQKHKPIIGDDALPVEFLAECMEQINNAAYIFCRWDNLGELPRPKSVIAWIKNNWTAGDLQHEHGRMWEACCFYALQGHEFTKRIPDVIHCAKTSNNLHPTQKPVELMAKLIAANVGETILDPFAGSGSTGRAAKNMRRKCVLVEREEKYCEVAANRMLQEVLPLEF